MNTNYIKFGKGDKTMLILPGVALKPVTINSEAIINAYEIFSNDFTVYLFDYPDDLKKGDRVADITDKLIKQIEELGLKDIYLLGVSLGGMISLEIALKRNDLIKKMVIASSVCRIDKLRQEWIEYARDRKLVEMIKDFCGYIYSEDFYNNYIDVIIEAFADTSDKQLDHFIILEESTKGFDVSKRISDIDIPSMVLGSKKDKIFDYREMEYLADLLNGHIYLYDEYSHAVYDEAPDFKKHIYDFYLREE